MTTIKEIFQEIIFWDVVIFGIAIVSFILIAMISRILKKISKKRKSRGDKK